MIPVILVTGASRGLGRGIALELAAKGYSVAVNYAGNVVAANETCQKCAELAPNSEQKFIPIQADISSDDARNAMVETVGQRHVAPRLAVSKVNRGWHIVSLGVAKDQKSRTILSIRLRVRQGHLPRSLSL